MTHPSVARFRLLNLDDDGPSTPLPADDGPGRAIQIDDETPGEAAARLDPTIHVHEGPALVGGLPGWYQGDRIARTSAGRLESGATGDGIRATVSETACQRARRLFGLDFSYSLEPAARANGRPVTGRHWVIRDDTDAVVSGDTVSDRYGLLQPECLDILDDVVGDCEIDRGGVFAGGSTVWLQTRLASFAGPNGETIETRALASNSYDRSSGFTVAFHPVVVQCQNYYRTVMSRAESRWRLRHVGDVASRVERLRDIFRQAGPYFADVQQHFLALGRVRITDDVVREIAREVFPVQDDGTFSARTANRVDQLMSDYREAPGAAPGSLWGAAQAFSYFATHRYSRATGLEGIEGSAGAWGDRAMAAVEVRLAHA